MHSELFDVTRLEKEVDALKRELAAARQWAKVWKQTATEYRAEYHWCKRYTKRYLDTKRWAKLWKQAAKEKRAARQHMQDRLEDAEVEALYAKLRAQWADNATASTVTPIPQISAASPMTTEILNPNVFYGSQLFARAARVLACAEAALEVVLKDAPDLAFTQPMPLSSTHVVFYCIQGGVPKSGVVDVSMHVHLSDAALTLEIARLVKSGLGLQ